MKTLIRVKGSNAPIGNSNRNARITRNKETDTTTIEFEHELGTLTTKRIAHSLEFSYTTKEQKNIINVTVIPFKRLIEHIEFET